MKKLEDTFEQTLVREEQQLATEGSGRDASEDAPGLQKSIRELKTKHEVSDSLACSSWGRCRSS